MLDVASSLRIRGRNCVVMYQYERFRSCDCYGEAVCLIGTLASIQEFAGRLCGDWLGWVGLLWLRRDGLWACGRVEQNLAWWPCASITASRTWREG